MSLQFGGSFQDINMQSLFVVTQPLTRNLNKNSLITLKRWFPKWGENYERKYKIPLFSGRTIYALLQENQIL